MQVISINNFEVVQTSLKAFEEAVTAEAFGSLSDHRQSIASAILGAVGKMLQLPIRSVKQLSPEERVRKLKVFQANAHLLERVGITIAFTDAHPMNGFYRLNLFDGSCSGPNKSACKFLQSAFSATENAANIGVFTKCFTSFLEKIGESAMIPTMTDVTSGLEKAEKRLTRSTQSLDEQTLLAERDALRQAKSATAPRKTAR